MPTRRSCARLGRELARLEPVVAAYRELNEVREQLAGARQMRDSRRDEEMRAMARDEISELEARETALVDDLRVSLLPRDPNDDRNVIVEIRAGAGGEEAALFASRAAPDVQPVRAGAQVRDRPDEPSTRPASAGSRRRSSRSSATAPTAGSSSRAASTASSGSRRPSPRGRIHTSTATVIVMPEADEVEVADRRGAGPPDRGQAQLGPGRPVGQHHRLRGPDHPHPLGPRRRDPGREEPAQEQGEGDVGAALAPLRPGAREATRT